MSHDLNTLDALEEYFNHYLNGTIVTPPSDKALSAYQQLYIRESVRQRGVEAAKVKMEKRGLAVPEQPQDVSKYSLLLDRVIEKKNKPVKV